MPLTQKSLNPKRIYSQTKKHNVMIKKTYENPESELLIVRFEGNFCTSPGDPGTPNGDYSDNPLEDLGD